MNQASTRCDVAAADKMAQLRRQFLDVITTEDMGAIVRKMIERAIEGSFQAAKMVLGYVLGRPGSAMPTEAAPPAPPKPKTTPSTVTKRVVTAPQSAGSVVPPTPPGPAMTPEMERFLSQPLTAEELNEARRTKLVGGR